MEKKVGKKRNLSHSKKESNKSSSVSKVHTVHSYISSPHHPISISLIGAGGNGSRLLSKLGQINAALRMLYHPGLFVKVYDNDKVERFNIGRQLYSESDLGKYKAVVSVERINRFFNTGWMAVPEKIDESSVFDLRTNFIITCVDNNHTRNIIHNFSKRKMEGRGSHETHNFYWLDMGNGKDRGQFNLSTVHQKNYTSTSNGLTNSNSLKSLIDMYGEQKDDLDTPSCSMMEALFKQDLFVNDLLVTNVASFLWNIIHKPAIINYQGMFLNFETNLYSEIPIQ